MFLPQFVNVGWLVGLSVGRINFREIFVRHICPLTKNVGLVKGHDL